MKPQITRISTDLLFAAILISLTFTTSCRQSKGLPDRHIKRPVNSSEIVGKWNITRRSLKRLNDEMNISTPVSIEQKIIFNDNGQCTFSGYVDSASGYIHLDNIEGTWSVKKVPTYVGHQYKEVAGIEMGLKIEETPQRIETYTEKLFIEEDNGQIILWKYLGDPDYVNYLDYRKSEN